MIKDCELLAQSNLPDDPPQGYRVHRLVGDASTRSYFRVTTPAGKNIILMLMPEPFNERQFPYLDNYHLMRGHDIPLAEIHLMEPSRGYVFLQDLGDDTFYELYGRWSRQHRLSHFLHSIDILVRISRIQPASPLAFDVEKLLWELNFFLEHFLKAHRGCRLTEDETKLLQEQFLRLSRELAERPRVFCHRDYHSRNLMLAGDRMYVIDFQDARFGPATYDLASL
ncbi:MAG TPA: phosphotransferase, partial [Acidobacteriota bacterium]|nr:phosphotransferase [Acidobacteriota bacterium]